MIHRIKKYVIEGNPISIGGKRRNFQEGIIEDSSLWQLLLNQQHGQEPLFDCPVKVKITFFFSNITNKSREKKRTVHSTYPAIDNLCQFIFESLNKVVLKDNRLISILSSSKSYAAKPYTEIIVEELRDNG